MKRVLMYSNRKTDPVLWDVSTKKQEDAAYLALVQLLDEDWQVYDGLDDPPAWDEPDAPSKQAQWYAAAKKGDALAARRLLMARRTYEYEHWHFVGVYDPLKS